MSRIMIRVVPTLEVGTYAKVYIDDEYGEYMAKFWRNGRQLPNADYFTDSEDDAHSTAQAELIRMGCTLADQD